MGAFLEAKHRQGGNSRSAGRARCSSVNLHRQESSRPVRLPGDAEVIVRIVAGIFSAGLCLYAQGLDPASILKPSADSWPTYNGDYSGKRFSALRQINKDNVGMLTLAWAFQTDVTGGPGLKSTPLLVDGTLYFTKPDDVWAVDARSGRQIWHYRYRQNEGLHIGQRGVGMYKGKLYFETPDAHLLCLDARSGEVQWDTVLADVKLGYWTTMAPLVIRNHVIVGLSGDFNDLHGFIDSIDPETGKLVWHLQPSSHDVHAWGAVQTPVIVDAEFHGTARKLLLQASRNGYFLVLDRTNGEALLSVPFEDINWSEGVDAKESPMG